MNAVSAAVDGRDSKDTVDGRDVKVARWVATVAGLLEIGRAHV